MAQRVTNTNTPELWDKVWTDSGLSHRDKDILATEEASKRWQQIRQIIISQRGDLNDLKVIELGAGIGTYAALMAKHGAQVTVVDYSPKALARAKQFFKHNGLKAHFIESNVFRLPKKLLNRYDISVSIGLAEHFTGAKRTKISKLHLDVLKENGLAFISVPNTYNPPYFIFKKTKEMFGRWKFGEEYPFTRSELGKLSTKIDGQLLTIFGDDFYTSLKFLLPANFLRRWFGVEYPQSRGRVRQEKGTLLDDYLSYSLTLAIKKPMTYFKLEEKRRYLAGSKKYSALSKTYSTKLSIINENTKQFWDERFNNDANRDLFPMELKRNQTVIHWLNEIYTANGKTLNVGCGDGKLEKKLADSGLELNHLGTDIAAEHIHLLRKKYPQFSFQIHDILKEKLPYNQFDIVFMLEVLEHIETRHTFKVLQKIYTTLKKGGYFLISVPMNEGLEQIYPVNPNSHMRCYSTELIKAELEITGFTVVKYREFYAFSSWFWLKDILARTVLQGKWQPNNVLVLAQKN